MAKKQTGTNKKKRERYSAKNPRGTKRGGRTSIERFKIKKQLFLKETRRICPRGRLSNPR